MLARLPLAFLENRGQWDAPAGFVARRGGMTTWIERDRLTLQLERREGERVNGVAVRLVFEGALDTASLEGEEAQPGVHNFYLGDDPSKWRTHVPGYASVLYRGLREGVELRVREQAGRLEYDLILAPGADLDRVTVRCEGTEGIAIEPDGTLEMRTAIGPIRHSPPVSWTTLPCGERRPIESRFRVLGTDRFGFEVPGRDPALPIVIDPGLVYSSFLGGTNGDVAYALALDATGAATVAGDTLSSNFPTTAGAYDTSYNNFNDAFVTRLSPSGGSLLYSTFLGGGAGDIALALALDASGAATVAGVTTPGFPTTAGAYDTSYNGGPADAFVARLSPSGGSLLYSTFLGSTGQDIAWAIALDATGAATVAGQAASGFPTTAGAYDTSYNGDPSDAFVARLSPSGASLLYSTFLGSTGQDLARALALDATGAASVAGQAASGFPTTAGAYDTSHNGGGDAFVARLSPSGSALLYSTFLGGSADDGGEALALDASGAASVVGGTVSSDFPTTAGAYDTSYNGGGDAFVARLSPSGASLVYSTFLGGAGGDFARGLALDASGAASVAGGTSSSDLPTTAGAFDTSFNGGLLGDAFVARLSPSGGSLFYSTYLGGSESDRALALALDPSGAATVAGETSSPSFPTTAMAFDTGYNGSTDSDAFVTRLDLFPTGATAYGTSTPGCAGPLAIGVTSMPQVGNAGFSVTCSNAPPNGPGVIGLSAGALASPFLILGLEIWIAPFSVLLLPVGSNAVGAAGVSLPIPPDPSLAGGQANLQFVFPSPCGPQGLSASNALTVIVQP